MRLTPFLLVLAACGTKQAPNAEVHHEDHHPEGQVAPAPVAAPEGWSHYGEAFTLAEAMPAADLLADPSAHAGKTIQVQARIAEVCQKKGCWMVIAEGDDSMRVLMKDHAFGIDMASGGRDCLVEGVVEGKPVDPEFVEHLRSESTGEVPMPEEKAEGGMTWQFVASGVQVKNPES